MQKIISFFKEALSEEYALYGIVDAGIYKDFLDLMDIEGEEQIRILLKAPYLHGFEEAAPYLIRLPLEDAVTGGLLHASLGEEWLTLIVSDKTLDDLATELRDMIVPYSEFHGHEIIYRFYDPRNLSNYILIHNDEESADFYNDIGGSLFVIDKENTDTIHVYGMDGVETINLKDEA